MSFEDPVRASESPTYRRLTCNSLPTQVLFAEYGFVLRKQDQRPASDGASYHWSGSPFSEVRLDEEVALRFSQQASEGKVKVGLLQDSGYWL